MTGAVTFVEQLSRLVNPRALSTTVDEAGAARGWWPAGGDWLRVYGRVGAAPYACGAPPGCRLLRCFPTSAAP